MKALPYLSMCISRAAPVLDSLGRCSSRMIVSLNVSFTFVRTTNAFIIKLVYINNGRNHFIELLKSLPVDCQNRPILRKL